MDKTITTESLSQNQSICPVFFSVSVELLLSRRFFAVLRCSYEVYQKPDFIHEGFLAQRVFPWTSSSLDYLTSSSDTFSGNFRCILV